MFSAALFFLLRADGADAQDVHAADANPVVALVQPWVDKNMIPGALVFLAGWSRP
jgi:hypothetical protein